jgi:hypothetical protein
MAGAMTLIQRDTAGSHRGRVFGALGAVEGVAIVAGTVAAGFLGQAVGIIPVLAVQGGGYVAAGLLVVVALRHEAPGRQRRKPGAQARQPDPQVELPGPRPGPQVELPGPRPGPQVELPGPQVRQPGSQAPCPDPQAQPGVLAARIGLDSKLPG